MRQGKAAGRRSGEAFHRRRRISKAGTGQALGLLVAGVLVLASCARSQYVLTECIDGRPVVERTLDVAPPNC